MTPIESNTNNILGFAGPRFLADQVLTIRLSHFRCLCNEGPDQLQDLAPSYAIIYSISTLLSVTPEHFIIQTKNVLCLFRVNL